MATTAKLDAAKIAGVHLQYLQFAFMSAVQRIHEPTKIKIGDAAMNNFMKVTNDVNLMATVEAMPGSNLPVMHLRFITEEKKHDELMEMNLKKFKNEYEKFIDLTLAIMESLLRETPKILNIDIENESVAHYEIVPPQWWFEARN
jgi:hypothetical protein